MLRVAFMGALSASSVESVRARLTVPCEILITDETNVLSLLPEVDVLVTLVLTPAMGAAAKRLRLVQVPGAGLDRIDRAALHPLGRMAAIPRALDRAGTGAGTMLRAWQEAEARG